MSNMNRRQFLKFSAAVVGLLRWPWLRKVAAVTPEPRKPAPTAGPACLPVCLPFCIGSKPASHTTYFPQMRRGGK